MIKPVAMDRHGTIANYIYYIYNLHHFSCFVKQPEKTDDTKKCCLMQTLEIMSQLTFLFPMQNVNQSESLRTAYSVSIWKQFSA